MTSALLEQQPPPFPRRKVRGLPGEGGRQQIRDTFAQLRDMEGFLRRRRERFGPCFAFGSFGFTVFAVGDPELVRTIHLDSNDDYSARLGWHFSIGQLFEGGLMLRDFQDHRHHRSLVQAAFRPSAMAGYMQIVDRCVTQTLDDWARRDKILFYPAMKSLGLRVALELILGISAEHDEAKRVGRAFNAAVQASVAAVRRPIPPLAYWRGLRGRAYLKAWLQKEISERRRAPRSDIFSRLCDTELSDQDIAHHLIFLIMAAHDTSASALTSCVWAACEHPIWQENMRDEAVSSPSALAYDRLDDLQVTDWVFKEALRFKPPAPFMMRRTVRDTVLGKYALPDNLAVGTVSMISHFLPDWWTMPDTFDPERFSPGRAEHKQHPGLYFPFGGGAHYCLGIHLAHMEAKVFLHQFWRRFRVESAIARPNRFRSIPIPYPVDGLPLRIKAVD